MMKSYVDSILGLYSGIFKDARANLPTVRGLDRDENRLLSTVEHRGIRYLTIDLPAYGKHFDKCLSVGRLTPHPTPNLGWIREEGLSHGFLHGLVSRVFDKDGVLLSQPCITSIFLLRQLFNGAKKIKVECTEKVREQSLLSYLQQEQSVRSPSLNWYGDRPDCRFGDRLRIDDVRHDDCSHSFDLFEDGCLDATFCDIVHDIADRVFSSFGVFDPREWRPKHGPGAVADSGGGSYKYDFPTWSERLEVVFPSSEFAYANYSWWADSVATSKVPQEIEVPSRAITVPKSQVTPRIIAKEPTANMWCQQMLRDYLESNSTKSVLRHCISFRDQSHNANLALWASHTQSHWTVDLSNASDRLTLWLIERLCRSNRSILDALWASRSVYCEVHTRDGRNLLRMKKFAPQGSATTFPLQTIVYAILAISSVIYARGWKVSSYTLKKSAKAVRIFGDDSIVPSDAGRQYLELLEYCGFSVNPHKTFGTGLFRESCGTEAYDGTDITPAYIVQPFDESAPTSVASVVECANNFFNKGLWHASDAMVSTLPPWVRKYLRVVGPGVGAFGLTSFVGSKCPEITRYNQSLQRYEGLALSLSTRVTRRQPGGHGHLLQYFTEKPTPDINWMSGVDGRPSSRVAKRWEPLGAEAESLSL